MKQLTLSQLFDQIQSAYKSHPTAGIPAVQVSSVKKVSGLSNTRWRNQNRVVRALREEFLNKLCCLCNKTGHALASVQTLHREFTIKAQEDQPHQAVLVLHKMRIRTNQTAVKRNHDTRFHCADPLTTNPQICRYANSPYPNSYHCDIYCISK